LSRTGIVYSHILGGTVSGEIFVFNNRKHLRRTKEHDTNMRNHFENQSKRLRLPVPASGELSLGT